MVNTVALLAIVFLYQLDLKQLQMDGLLGMSTITRPFLQLQKNLLISLL